LRCASCKAGGSLELDDSVKRAIWKPSRFHFWAPRMRPAASKSISRRDPSLLPSVLVRRVRRPRCRKGRATFIARCSTRPGAALAPLPPCRAHSSKLRSGIRVFRDCDGAPEMIALRGGGYRMGDLIGDGLTYERPAHDVQIEPVALGRFEVTNAEWNVCVTAGGCSASHLQGTISMAATRWRVCRGHRPRPMSTGSLREPVNPTACPPRPSGSMRRAPVKRTTIPGAASKRMPAATSICWM